MWFFKRKKASRSFKPGRPCPHCVSMDTIVVSYHGTDRPDYIKVWRGERLVTCRCLSCGRHFYAEEPPGGFDEETLANNRIIDDEEELLAAEKEIKRQADDLGDHTYRLNGP